MLAMECAGKGSRSLCLGPPTILCSRCGAVAYCSISHKILHWSVHKHECERLERQMAQIDALKDFPFTFYQEKNESRCAFLIRQGVHQLGMWQYECSCGALQNPSSCCSRVVEGWNLSSTLSPWKGETPVPEKIASWKDYYEWRRIPLCSPVALLLHWPLTLYWASQLATLRVGQKLRIHYLGPDKELHQLGAFGELHALFPGVEVHIDFVGPEIPQVRDGERIEICCHVQSSLSDCECTNSLVNRSSRVSVQLHAGYYHDIHRKLLKDSSPDLIVALDAGIAAYRSWLPTIELLKEMKVAVVFSDFCEEASHLASNCIRSITGSPLAIPVQLNPFRQPLPVEDSALLLPCYSNCFIFGM